jgi:DNA recombination protein RmuC
MDINTASVLFFGMGALLGGGAGFVMARAMRGRNLETLQAEKQTLQALLDERQQQHKIAIQDKQDEIRNGHARTSTLNDELQQARAHIATLQAEKEGLDRRIEDHKTDLEAMQEKLHLSFETLSNRIFEEKTDRFKQQSRESLDQLLTPLKDKLADFHKKVEDSFGHQAKDQHHLKEEINRIVETHKNMVSTTEALTKALRGESKVQGDWGEIMLEKILEDAGLRRGHEYIAQGADLGLRDADSHGVQKPDIIITLPDSKTIIVDSKVSLTHYERYCAAEDDAERREHLKDFLGSVRKHVGDLAEKRYHYNEKLNTVEMVLMFMPIEGAYSLALQQDHALHSYAWEKKIALVCPSTLFIALRTIASVWQKERQHRNVEEIARVGGDLHDKIASFIEDMGKLGDQIRKLDIAYDATFKKLSTGRGNIRKRADDLRRLGAKTAKKLSIHEEDETGAEEDETLSADIKQVESA